MKPGGPEVIHVNFRSAEVDPVYFPEIQVVGDIANAIWQIKQTIAPQSHWNFSRIDTIRRAAEAHLQQGADDDCFPIYPQRLVAEVRKAMPSDGIIALDNGVYKIWFARNYKAQLTQLGAARQRPGDHGRGFAVGDGGASRSPPAQDHGHLR